ncbi:uncharacterized protein LOC143896448 [Temnothorax americanus]|uniref:uncharacterized protein LOC143896448 n=1 Tax=Temnothorax americanus TaxID=1964332 RepID=UPI004068F4A6
MGPKSDLFTKEIECILIQMVRQRHLLWDTSTEEYRRTDLKRMHWDQIAEALGPKFTGESVYKRFQSMESTFRANERKIKASKARCSGKGTDEIYKPKWDYYEMLLFLKKTCAQSETIDNLSSQSQISTASEETMNCLSTSKPYSDVQNLSQVTDIYYDENAQQYMLIPSDSSGPNNAADASDETSHSEHSDLHVSSKSSSDRSFAPLNARQPLSIISNISSNTSSGIVTSSPSAASAPLNTNKRSIEAPMYTKRGRKSNAMEHAVDAIRNLAKQKLPPSNMDKFDMFSAYIASKLRSMIPEDQEYYEKEILRVLIQPRLQ